MLRSSTRRRIMAMRHRALLALRLPPRFRRCLRIVPEDASIGLVPHRAAKEASLRIRSGLSPAAVSSAAAVSGPTPSALSSAGLARAHKRCSSVFSSLISVVRVWWRRARQRRARLAAPQTTSPVVFGRSRAHILTAAVCPMPVIAVSEVPGRSRQQR